jgi:hypothetical protein
VIFVCVGCADLGDGHQILDKHQYTAPPAAQMLHPGPMVDGPGPGVLPMYASPNQGRVFATQTTQVRFIGPAGMQIGWQIPTGYAENQLTTPGRYNFIQGSSYRLKFTNIPGRQITLYPTLEVYPAHPTTDSYLSHNSVPIELSVEDLDQIESNNFVTKVIYLPDPKFQELAIAGVETLVSTRLDPGVDPVAEADRRGTIMAVLRVGNMDLEMPVPQPVEASVDGGSKVQQVAYEVADGAQGQFVPPMPIAGSRPGMIGVPPAMIMGAAPPGPGMPAVNPISGVGGAPQWGYPLTSTPIGLPGPPHLPLGGPAGLKSHTTRNLTKQEIPQAVDHFLLDVKHEPGIRMPAPVKHVEYSEEHPVYKPGEVAYPNWALPPQECPPQ